MSSQYVIEIETVADDKGGMAADTSVASHLGFPFARNQRAANNLCMAIGITPELMALHRNDLAAVEIPLKRVAQLHAQYSDDFIATDRNVTVNGHLVDRVARRADIAALINAQAIAVSGRATRAFLRRALA